MATNDDDAILARFRQAVEKHRGWEVPYTLSVCTAVWVIMVLMLLPLMIFWTSAQGVACIVVPSTAAWAIVSCIMSFVVIVCVRRRARGKIGEHGALEQWLRDNPEACGKAWAHTTLLVHTPAGSAWILRICDAEACGSVEDALKAAEAPGFAVQDPNAPAA